VRAVNIRQLKNNPSQALRHARQNPVVVVSRDQPEALLIHLDNDALLAEPGVRLALATGLYREESLSLGQAARFCALPIGEFLLHVSRLGIPVVRGTPRSVKDDLQTIATWRNGSSRLTPVR
jgi:predicted HTH domain antitoxin